MAAVELYFNRQGLAEARTRISGLKARYGNVGSYAPDNIDEHTFGKGDSSSGMHRTVSDFSAHVRDQFSHAERLLEGVERALDDTEQSHTEVEEANLRSFDS